MLGTPRNIEKVISCIIELDKVGRPTNGDSVSGDVENTSYVERKAAAFYFIQQVTTC